MKIKYLFFGPKVTNVRSDFWELFENVRFLKHNVHRVHKKQSQRRFGIITWLMKLYKIWRKQASHSVMVSWFNKFLHFVVVTVLYCLAPKCNLSEAFCKVRALRR